MKRILFLALFFVSCLSVIAQNLETKLTQGVTINGNGWNKVLKSGDPVTIFAYKQKDGIHSFGIYSDDYAGVIDMKTIPFKVDSKQLKKLPSNSKKKLTTYTEMACAKARKKALAGEYKTIATDIILSNDRGLSINIGEQMTVLGYRTERSYVGSYTYYYSIVGKNGAGIAYSNELHNITINNVPLPFLPSTSDPQVQAALSSAKTNINDRKVAEARATREKLNKEIEEQAAQKKALEEQEFADLKLMDPAHIKVKKINMDSAGGNEVTIKFTNCSSQRIKYVYFTGYFLNAVGDKCRNEVGGSTVWKYTGVGPISRIPDSPNNYGSHIKFFHSDPPFYSKTARKFVISSVTIEYMNGKKTVLSGSELDYRIDYEY